VPPVWELRVRAFRVFYDVDEDAKLVHVRAVRRKNPRDTTGGKSHENHCRQSGAV
jgi:mRNA-degrading endonuclease RelE of RelBE toxin-antitoxin system